MRARGRGLLWCAACASGLVGVAEARAAEADALDLVWEAPDSCSTGDDVRREFERSTRVLPGRSPPHLSATAHVEARDGRWSLRLHTSRGGVEGDREIEADSCASLTRAAALVLALAYGEGAEPETPAPSEPPALPTPAPPVPTVARAEPAGHDVSPVTPSRTRLAWSVTLDGRVAWGPVPGPAAGAATTLDVRGPWWGVSARVISWPGASGEPVPDLRTHFAGVGGSLSMCLLARPSHDLLFAGCGGLQASALRGTSSGATSPGDAVAPWYAAPAGVRTRVRLFDTLHLEAGFELAASLTRPTFVVSGLSAPVYEVPKVSPSGSLGLSLDI
jgi:hypothetical protein